ncbi:MAG TPA: hypothetical protein VI231_20630, partial [Candidatus Binatia bacterium]
AGGGSSGPIRNKMASSNLTAFDIRPPAVRIRSWIDTPPAGARQPPHRQFAPLHSCDKEYRDESCKQMAARGLK